MKFYFMLFQATLRTFVDSPNFPIFATVMLIFAIVIALIQGFISESLKAMNEGKNINGAAGNLKQKGR